MTNKIKVLIADEPAMQMRFKQLFEVENEASIVGVAATAEETIQKAKALGIPVLRRSELLALIAASKKTIAVGGTSGKSTTSAMLFDILEEAGLSPSIISGAGLISIMKEGKIGNAKVFQNTQGKGFRF